MSEAHGVLLPGNHLGSMEYAFMGETGSTHEMIQVSPRVLPVQRHATSSVVPSISKLLIFSLYRPKLATFESPLFSMEIFSNSYVSMIVSNRRGKSQEVSHLYCFEERFEYLHFNKDSNKN